MYKAQEEEKTAGWERKIRENWKPVVAGSLYSLIIVPETHLL
jgi:hypothetical protein